MGEGKVEISTTRSIEIEGFPCLDRSRLEEVLRRISILVELPSRRVLVEGRVERWVGREEEEEERLTRSEEEGIG